MKLVRTLGMVVVMSLAGIASAKAPPVKKAAKTPPAAAKAPELTQADLDAFLAFFDKLVDTAVADAKDCTKMATDINATIDGNADMMAKAKQAKAQGKKLPAAAKDHMMTSVKRMIPALQACQKDAGVKAAFKRLDMK